MQRAACMGCKSFVILRRTSSRIAAVVGFVWAVASGGALAAADCSAAEYRAFDFWLGHWDVFVADGRQAGTNLISRTDDGCLIQERWQSAGGGTGYSMNYFDPTTSRWRQVWVSADSVIDISGGIEDGAMNLTGEIRYRESGEVKPFRGNWRLLDDGRVRQFFEEQSGDTWEPWFEGFYAKAVE